MNDRRYAAFGMNLHSQIPLALPSADRAEPSGRRVDICKGEVPEDILLARSIGKIRYGRVGETLCFDVPGVARYAIEGDARIIVDSLPGSSGDAVGLYITGLLLVVLLGSRNVITLHGSAVAGKSGSLVFTGDRGAGKSTIAAAMTALGYTVLCDDVVPITSASLVLPGIPYPKLLPDAYERLIGDPSEAAHLFDGVDKYQAMLPRSADPSPITMLFIIETTENPVLRIEALKGAVKIQKILQNVTSLAGVDDPARLFILCTERLGSIPCFRVSRPLSVDCLDELAEAVAGLDSREVRDGNHIR